jgi:hypothetical protein
MMMKSWEETIKCEFGKNMNGGDEYVSVPGIRDNPDANVEDSAHAMERYVLSLCEFDKSGIANRSCLNTVTLFKKCSILSLIELSI